MIFNPKQILTTLLLLLLPTTHYILLRKWLLVIIYEPFRAGLTFAYHKKQYIKTIFKSNDTLVLVLLWAYILIS